ncbi:hypothetical protein GCM10020358_34080 [Amorphoplanes nipponensis]|uniref:Uncharacterized protein n=1 Tax=Actinoplanes nipponensis TaxID=135950 RepID=A0A919JEQ1_9ACTN|nr:hypothetical protein [Actinoplanes nipponensis]GIE49106.1 hypothetical protein Ani05nite_26400 [Actinoplanes nipponensis]
MLKDVWLNRPDQFAPGAELFRSDRTFQLLAYSASHSQLLLSSRDGADGEPCGTVVEILFKPVEAVRVQECYRGLVVSCATGEEAAAIDAGISPYGYRARDARAFILRSQGVEGYVVATAVGTREGVLPRMRQSLFHGYSPEDTAWPTGPLGGVGGGLTVASPAEVAHAVLHGVPDGARRDRHRTVHVLYAKGHDAERLPVGVFLTAEDAAEAQRLVRPTDPDCVVLRVPVVL